MHLFPQIYRQLLRIMRDVRFVAFAIVAIVILIKVQEYTILYKPFRLVPFLDDLQGDIRSESISVALAVLIFEYLIHRRLIRLEKEALLFQLASPNSDFSVEAARILQAKGWLSDGTLTEVFLIRGNLQGALMWNAVMNRAELMQANMQGINLLKADLSDAQMWEANLMNAELIGIDLRRANLHRANLVHVQMWEANLEETVMDYADLTNANLRQANLKNSVLIHANLCGVDFAGARMSGARLVNAEFDESTTLPDGTRWHHEVDMTRFTDKP